MKPPRALWVPFELGRPVGSPNEPAFQRRVISAALALLESKDGPAVLKDFNEEAPGPAADKTGWVCPISFPAAAAAADDIAAAFRHEFESLAPWYQLSLDKRGRTTVGVSQLSLDDIAEFFAAAAKSEPAESPVAGQPLETAVKDAFTDLLAYYSEAATAQPGQRSSGDVMQWFWYDTSAGALLQAFRSGMAASDNQRLQAIAQRLMMPKSLTG